MFNSLSHLPARRPPVRSGIVGEEREPPPHGADPAPAIVDLGQVLRAVRHRRKLVLLCVALGVGAALYVARTRTPEYAAVAVIRLSDARRSIAGDLADASLRAENASTDPILSEMEILRSRAVAGRVVDRPDAALLRLRTEGIPAAALQAVHVAPDAPTASITLRFDADRVVAIAPDDAVHQAAYGAPLTVGGVTITIAERPEAREATLQVLSRERAISAVVGGSSTRRRQSTNVVDVTFTATDPLVAQLGATLLVSEYQRANLDALRERSRRRREFLEAQLAGALVQTDALRDSLARFRGSRSARSVNEPLGRAQSESEIAEVVARRERTLADRARYEQLVNALQQGDDRAGRDVRLILVGAEPNPVVDELATQVARLVATRDSLTTGPWARAASHPDVVRLDALAARARAQLADAARSHLEVLTARAGELGRVVSRGTGQLARLPATDAEESRLADRQASYQQVSEHLREEYQRAQIAEAVQAGDVEIVDEAPVPGQRAGIAAWRLVALGLLLGLGTGVTAAYSLEQVRRTMRRREDVESYLGLPSLALIPMARVPARQRLARLMKPGRERADLGSRLIQGAAGSTSTLPEEAFRTLRTNLLFSDGTHSSRTIAVTSARVGEGKTTVTANLAISLAEQGMRVLLVDGDLRRPRLHTTFAAELAPGLADAIVGTVSPTAAVQPTRYPSVFLLTAGGATPRAVERFGVAALRDVLAGLAREFDFIIVDTPPILAAADATVVAAMSDAVVFVVRAGSTSQDEGRRALRQLERVGAPVAGAVLNDRDARTVGADPYYSDIRGYVSVSPAGR